MNSVKTLSSEVCGILSPFLNLTKVTALRRIEKKCAQRVTTHSPVKFISVKAAEQEGIRIVVNVTSQL